MAASIQALLQIAAVCSSRWVFMILFLLIMKFVMRRIVPYTLIDGFWKADVTAFLKIFLFPFFTSYVTGQMHPICNTSASRKHIFGSGQRENAFFTLAPWRILP